MFKINPNDNTMTLTKNNSAEFIISPTVADENGTIPYILQEGERIIFTVKSRYSDDKLIEKILTSEDYEDTELIIRLTRQETSVLDVETYVYDVAFQPSTDDKFQTFIPLSYFNVVKRVSEAVENG